MCDPCVTEARHNLKNSVSALSIIVDHCSIIGIVWHHQAKLHQASFSICQHFSGILHNLSRYFYIYLALVLLINIYNTNYQILQIFIYVLPYEGISAKL